MKYLVGFTAVTSLVVKGLLADEKTTKVYLLAFGDGGCGMVGHFIDLGLDPKKMIDHFNEFPDLLGAAY